MRKSRLARCHDIESKNERFSSVSLLYYRNELRDLVSGPGFVVLTFCLAWPVYVCSLRAKIGCVNDPMRFDCAQVESARVFRCELTATSLYLSRHTSPELTYLV